jgi:hypothetical protein
MRNGRLSGEIRSTRSLVAKSSVAVRRGAAAASRPPSDSVNAKLFHQFLEQYVSGLRSTTADSPPPPPLFTATWAGCMFDVFHLVGVDDVMTAVRGLPDKQSALDPLPNKLYTEGLCRHSGFFLMVLFNRCLACGQVPMLFEESFLRYFRRRWILIRPTLKTIDLYQISQ